MNIEMIYIFQQFIGLVLLFIFSVYSIAQEQAGFLEISKFVEGDTFWVNHPSGEDQRIRFTGINTQEARDTGRTQIKYFGKETSAYICQLLIGKRVRLEYDVQRFHRYNWLLAYVYLENGTFLNVLLKKRVLL